MIGLTLLSGGSSMPKESNKTGLKILIVDDDPICRLFLEKILGKPNVLILTADNGNKAVEICSMHTDIDLILMDIQMPVMDGIEATQEIRKFNSEVIIIAQTAYGLQDRKKAFKAGFNEYMLKPIVKSKLLDIIATYFDNYTTINPNMLNKSK